jgi:hypothetical protein
MVVGSSVDLMGKVVVNFTVQTTFHFSLFQFQLFTPTSSSHISFLNFDSNFEVSAF